MSTSTAVGTPVVLVQDNQLVACDVTSGQWLTTAPRGMAKRPSQNSSSTCQAGNEFAILRLCDQLTTALSHAQLENSIRR
jgi:hypothetical protein